LYYSSIFIYNYLIDLLQESVTASHHIMADRNNDSVSTGSERTAKKARTDDNQQGTEVPEGTIDSTNNNVSISNETSIDATNQKGKYTLYKMIHTTK
jgi:hypothetical protein